MKLDIEVKSPLHIGDGDNLSRDSLLFQGHRAYVPDLDAYFRDNPDQIQEFVDAMEHGEPVSNFFDEPSQYTKYSLEPWSSKQEIGKSEVATAIKDANGDPYIPGSSIKGYVRTALAYRALTEGGQELRSFDDRSVDDLFRLDRNDPKHDLLRCLTVRDTDAADDDALVIGEIKTYSLSHDGAMEPKFWSNYAEMIRPGTTFSTEITVDTSLLYRMVNSFGEQRKARAVFGDEHSEQAILETVTEALRSLQRSIVREDRALTEEFDEVESFYDDLNADYPHLRLGHGKGYHSNTVATALPKEDRTMIRVDNYLGKQLTHIGCGGDLTRDRENEGKLFCHECYTSIDPESDEVAPPFPKTRRLVHRDGSPSFPLGWIEARFHGPS